jgi:hypothetical protein
MQPGHGVASATCGEGEGVVVGAGLGDELGVGVGEGEGVEGGLAVGLAVAVWPAVAVSAGVAVGGVAWEHAASTKARAMSCVLIRPSEPPGRETTPLPGS